MHGIDTSLIKMTKDYYWKKCDNMFERKSYNGHVFLINSNIRR
ncbi:MAG: DUF1882 domain-containing protein [Sulfurospirillum sp.]|nr:DUF1882 domain-containing protein [Sulfurospirillum sp.]MBL0702632.1 DUF1882 domain-containing protein [Sulfurospirillum sp.]